MTDLRKDYPSVPLTPPTPVQQTPCAYCAGTGWIETHIDDRGIGHGDRCVYCGGRGIVWIEVPNA